MIIQSGNIGMNSRRHYSKSEAAFQSLQTWGSRKNGKQLSLVGGSADSNTSKQGSGSSTIPLKQSVQDIAERFRSSQRISSAKTQELKSSLRQIQMDTINYLLRQIFGFPNGAIDLSGSTQAANIQQDFGGHYESAYAYSEQEFTSFETTGTVITADGRRLDFNVNVAMSRSFEEYSHTVMDFGAPQLTDPLVINLNGSVASVSDQTFLFDLDADGTMESISMLNAGSGYLALDKNGDGRINDGSELFGTTSGDGFQDLAAYDSDGNGWIDEADPIFSQLRIWSRDQNGKDVLVGLSAAGIGAIYLGSADTEFSLNSAKDNSTNAVIRKTGIFLYENGSAGTIQHLDVADHFAASS